mgnify:CR=1 FL=1
MVSAYILVTVKTGTEYDVVDEIKKIVPKEKLKDVVIVYGMFDIVVVLEANSLSELEKLVLSIRKIDKITSTTTLVSSKV